MTGIAHVTSIRFVVATAGFADEQLTVHTATFALEQELERLQTVDAVGRRPTGPLAQQLPLDVLSFHPGLQVSETRITHTVSKTTTLTRDVRC